jgi:molybdopterin-binding protein
MEKSVNILLFKFGICCIIFLYMDFYHTWGGSSMKISGRNKFQATVKEIIIGGVAAKVIMDYKGEEIIAATTVDAVDDLGLKTGDVVTASVKTTEVMVLK